MGNSDHSNAHLIMGSSLSAPAPAPAPDPFEEKPWRKIGFTSWTKEKRNELAQEIRDFKLESDDTEVDHLNVLLIGQVSAGKSSLINNIDSAFSPFVTSRAVTGAADSAED